MHGNVWELCLDAYVYPDEDCKGSYYKYCVNHGIVDDPLNSSGDPTAKRGGCYADHWLNCQSAVRYVLLGPRRNTGFRLCKEVE